MAKTISLITPGAKAHYSKTNMDANFDAVNDNFIEFLHLDGVQIAANYMRGDLDMAGNRITNVPSPSASYDVATKAYVDETLTIGSTIGTIGSLVVDADGDTYLKTELTADEDIVHIASVGADKLKVSTSGTLVMDELTMDTNILITNLTGSNTIELGDSVLTGAILFNADSSLRVTIDGTNNLFKLADNLQFTAVNKGIQDIDGDTRILVERTADLDTIELIAGGVTQLSVTSTGITFGTAGSLNTTANVGVGTATHASGADNVLTIAESTFPTTVGANTAVVGVVDVGGVDTAVRIKTELGSLIDLGQTSTFDDVTIGDDLSVTGDITLGGDITLTGGATITGAVALTGDLAITGALSVTGNITLGDATTDTVECNAKINLDKIGTVGAAGWPSFSASSASQTITSTAITLIVVTEDIDTNSNFAANTFTPTVAGTYLIGCTCIFSADTAAELYQVMLYKNGANAGIKAGKVLTATTNQQSIEFCGIITANGTTDYFDARIVSIADTSYTISSRFFGSRIA